MFCMTPLSLASFPPVHSLWKFATEHMDHLSASCFFLKTTSYSWSMKATNLLIMESVPCPIVPREPLITTNYSTVNEQWPLNTKPLNEEILHWKKTAVHSTKLSLSQWLESWGRRLSPSGQRKTAGLRLREDHGITYYIFHNMKTKPSVKGAFKGWTNSPLWLFQCLHIDEIVCRHPIQIF